jgi:TPR repeat protein
MYKIACCVLLLSTPTVSIAASNKPIQEQVINFTQAKTQLEYLAKVGNPEAQYKLAHIYYLGKAGNTDKISAFGWFFLASEYNYEDAKGYANDVFSELTDDEKIKAKSKAVELTSHYGEVALVTKKFPFLSDTKISSQTFSKNAEMSDEYVLRADDNQLIDKAARARKAAAEQRAELISNLNKGYRHNARDNISKLGLEDASGLVIVKHSVTKTGSPIQPEVIFSWPVGQYDDPVVNVVKKSTFSPGVINGDPNTQHGIVYTKRIGKRGKNSFRTEYPNKYRYFLKMKKESPSNNKSKYIYANLLRAYEEIIGAKQPKTYQQLLKELSQENFVLAQYDYAQYLIFQEKDIDIGLYWLLQAAKFGHTQAEYRLGEMLINPPSEYLQKDQEKAKFWLARAAARGHEKANEKLSQL